MFSNFSNSIVLLIGVLFLVGYALFMWFSAYQEASIFNRITGSDVSTWEALWVNLRIDCQN